MKDKDLSSEFEEYASIVRLGELLDDEMLEKLTKLLGVTDVATNKVDAVKALIETHDYAKNQELHRSVADLEKGIVQIQRQATALMREADTLDREKLELERENQKLRDELASLKQIDQSDLTFQDGVWVDDQGNEFCPACLNDGQCQPVSTRLNPVDDSKVYFCPIS